jgi:hypothetical protein
MLPDVPSQHLEKVVAVNAPAHITLELISAARDCRFELCFFGYLLLELRQRVIYWAMSICTPVGVSAQQFSKETSEMFQPKT